MSDLSVPWLSGPPFAHRGLHVPGRDRPENSMAAFAAAAAGGFGIELDVQLSADSVPMVFHDDDLSRLAGDPAPISALTAAGLGAKRLAGGREPIPTLAQVLETFGESRLLIEVKTGRLPFQDCASAVAGVLGAGYPHAAVMSFHPGIVAWFAQERPDRCRGQVATDASRYPADYDADEIAALMASLDRRVGEPHFLAYDIRHLPAPLTRTYRQSGRPVLTWTVRSAEERRRGTEHADNLIFEEAA